MSRNNSGETFVASLIVIAFVLFIGYIGMSCENKCSKHGCDNTCDNGNYCYLHDRSSGWSSSSGSSWSGSSSSSSSSSYDKLYGSSSSSSSSKKYSSSGSRWDSYDEGYDDIMDYEDYDYDRYELDPEYATGVDDAMEDFYDEYGEEW